MKILTRWWWAEVSEWGSYLINFMSMWCKMDKPHCDIAPNICMSFGLLPLWYQFTRFCCYPTDIETTHLAHSFNLIASDIPRTMCPARCFITLSNFRWQTMSHVSSTSVSEFHPVFILSSLLPPAVCETFHLVCLFFSSSPRWWWRCGPPHFLSCHTCLLWIYCFIHWILLDIIFPPLAIPSPISFP